MARRSNKDLSLLQRGLAASIFGGDLPGKRKRPRRDDDEGDHEHGRGGREADRRPVVRRRPGKEPEPKGYVESVTPKPRER